MPDLFNLLYDDNIRGHPIEKDSKYSFCDAMMLSARAILQLHPGTYFHVPAPKRSTRLDENAQKKL